MLPFTLEPRPFFFSAECDSTLFNFSEFLWRYVFIVVTEMLDIVHLPR